jgi:hypothetical protein
MEVALLAKVSTLRSPVRRNYLNESRMMFAGSAAPLNAGFFQNLPAMSNGSSRGADK